jgi:hypothetical protein
MATATTIQYLPNTATSELGGSVAIKTQSNRRQIESFTAGGAIVVGDWVAFDTTQTDAARLSTVVQAGAVVLGNSLVVGVAITAAAVAGDIVQVVVDGYVEGANVVNGVAIGVSISVTAAAGRANATAAADLAPSCGVTLEASVVANTCDVWVRKAF